MSGLKIAIIREGKNPPDRRVPLSPFHCKMLIEKYKNVQVIVQSSPIRCFTDEEYRKEGIEVREDVSDCDVFLGVKEVPVNQLIAEKTYLFFSHTIKKQPYNKRLLQEILLKNIRLIDYECLVYKDGMRVIGFGRWAGVVGAYNGFRAYGMKYNLYELKPAHSCFDLKELLNELKKVELRGVRGVMTGSGRVGKGALEILDTLPVKRISPKQFLAYNDKDSVFTVLDIEDYYSHKSGKEYNRQEFFAKPEEYVSGFLPYAQKADIYIASHFWDSKSPVFFTKQQMNDSGFKLKVIADISCDINGPIPSTIRPSTIAEPFYGIDKKTGAEIPPFSKDALTVMAVDNLPCELPRDASFEFGNALVSNVLNYIIESDSLSIISRATITEKGALTSRYSYLNDYVSEKA